MLPFPVQMLDFIYDCKYIDDRKLILEVRKEKAPDADKTV